MVAQGAVESHRDGLFGSGGTNWLAGVGLDLVAGQAAALARTDLSLERGTRDAGTVTEDFWRFGISVQVSGF